MPLKLLLDIKVSYLYCFMFMVHNRKMQISLLKPKDHLKLYSSHILCHGLNFTVLLFYISCQEWRPVTGTHSVMDVTLL